jgi:hypothetical protein
MQRLAIILVFAIFLVVGGGLVFLTTWDIPAPSHKVKRTLDDSRFPR